MLHLWAQINFDNFHHDSDRLYRAYLEVSMGGVESDHGSYTLCMEADRAVWDLKQLSEDGKDDTVDSNKVYYTTAPAEEDENDKYL